MACLFAMALSAQQTRKLTIKVSPKPICDFKIYVDNPETKERVLQFNDNSVRYVNQPLDIPVGYKVKVETRDMDYFLYYENWTLKEVVGNVVFTSTSGWSNSWQHEFVMPADDLTLTYVFEFNPQNPQNPSTNGWYPETGQVVIDDPSTGGNLGEAMAKICNFPEDDWYDQVHGITLIGSVLYSYLGLYSSQRTNLTAFESLDFSRTTGITELKYMYYGAYYRMESLRELLLPATITKLEEAALQGTYLQSLTLYSTTPPEVATKTRWVGGEEETYQTVFPEDGIPQTVFVPEESLPLYRKAFFWKDCNLQPIVKNARKLTVNILPGTPSAEQIRPYVGMTLCVRDTKSGGTRSMIITSHSNYVFRTLPANAYYDVQLLTRGGSVAGELKNVYLDEDQTVTLPSLRTPQSVELQSSWKGEVTWLTAGGQYLMRYEIGGEKTLLSGVLEGDEIMACLKFADTASDTYKLRDTLYYTVTSGNNVIVYQRKPLPKYFLYGKVYDNTTNDVVRNASVVITRIGGGANVSMPVNMLNGVFDTYGIEGVYEVTVAHPQYRSEKMTVNLNQNYTFNADKPSNALIFMLTPSQGSTIMLNVGMEKFYNGYATTTSTSNIDLGDCLFCLHNLTTGEDISDFATIGTNLRLNDILDVGTKLRITVSSRSGNFAPETIEGTWGEQGLQLAMMLKENGVLRAKYGQTVCSFAGALLFGSDGQIVARANYGMGEVIFKNLPEDDYTMVSLDAQSNWYRSVSSIDQLSSLLVKDLDYVANKVTVRRLVVTDVEVPTIPQVRNNVQLYTVAEECTVAPSKPSLITGNYQTYRAKMLLRPEYRDKAEGVELVIGGLSNSCQFIEGSVMVGSSISTYTYQSGMLVVPMAQSNQPVRFCVVPTVANTYAPTCELRFILDGKQVRQPVPVESFVAENSTLAAPTVITGPRLAISGTCAPQASIKVVDTHAHSGAYGDVIATAQADMQGNWNVATELKNLNGLSYHNIVALITTKEGVNLKSETQTVIYDPKSIRPIDVTMTHFNEWYKREMKMVFDYETGTRTPDSYYFYHTAEFTFVVNLTNNDPKVVQAVDLNVFTSDNDYVTLSCTYDETSQRWVAHDEFSAGRLPVSVSCDVVADTPVEMDATAYNSAVTFHNNVTESLREYNANLEKKVDAIAAQMNADDFQVSSQTIVDILQQYKDILDDLDASDSFYEDAKQIYGSAYDPANPDPVCPYLPGFRPNPRYDGEEGMERWIADVEASIAEFDKMQNELDLKALQDALFNGPELNQMGNDIPGVNYSPATGLTALYLLNEGYEAIAMDNGKSIYYKLFDTYYILVDLENNLKIQFAPTDMASFSRRIGEPGGFLAICNDYLDKLEKMLKDALESTNNLITWVENGIKECIAAEKKYKISEKEWVKYLAELPSKTWQNSTRVKPLVQRIGTRLASCTRLVNLVKSTQEKLKWIIGKSTWLGEKLKTGIGGLFNIMGAWDGIKEAMELVGELSQMWELLPLPCEKHPIQEAAIRLGLLDLLTTGVGPVVFKAGVDVAAFCAAVLSVVGIASLFAAPAGALTFGATVGVELGVMAGMSVIGWWTKKRVDFWWNRLNAIRNDCDLTCEEKKTCCKKADGTPCCKNGNCKKKPEPKPDFPDGKPIMDPSGFVYEAVPSNRLEGVKATVYYKETSEDMYGDVHVTPVVWDAEHYAQENPLFTDENGEYAWDVPQGQWQVIFEKDGYETTRTEWLPVPPPQLDINIGMKQYLEPSVLKVKAYEQEVRITFDKYMKPATLNAVNISLMKGEEILDAALELLDNEMDVDGDGASFASRLRVIPSQPLTKGQQVTLVVAGSVESYAGVQMSNDYMQTFTVEEHVDTIMADSVCVVRHGNTRTVKVMAGPAAAAAGKKLVVTPVSASIADVEATQLTLNAQGAADITVKGLLPGTAALRLTLEGEEDLERFIMVNVRDSAGVYTKAPEASRATGSQVFKGERIYLTSQTPDAKIWYSLDGTCPCDMTVGHVFPYNPETGVEITSDSILLKALAIANDYEESNVATFRYILAKASATFDMAQGWNWISSNLADNLDVTQLSVSSGSYVMTSDGVTTVQTMQPATVYKAYMSNRTTATVTGAAFNTAEYAQMLIAGWNWVAYTLQRPLTVADALSTTKAAEGDMLVGQDGFVEYVNGQWTGTLRTLVPGKGYRYYATESIMLCLNSAIIAEPEPVDTYKSHWPLDMHRYPELMPVTAILTDGAVELGDDYVVAAFNNDFSSCLGEAQWVDGRLLLLVGGEQNALIRYIALHQPTGKLYDIQETANFFTDRRSSRQHPMTLTIGGENTGVNAVMLPVSDGTMPLYDLQGRRINGQYQRGIYVSGGRKVVVK